MEHRWHERNQFTYKIVLRTQEGEKFRGRTLNISHGGVLVRILEKGAGDRFFRDIERSGIVSVQFHSEQFEVILPALVLRYRNDIVALMFTLGSPQFESLVCEQPLEDEPPRRDGIPNITQLS